MTATLTVDGYTFDNPPTDFRKKIDLSNEPQPHFRRFTADFYQSNSQDVELQVQGMLSLNESTDLSELQTLQDTAISGGEVNINFDPFFSGTGVITDNPFRQENERGRYDFTFKINDMQTDPSAYPAHATPQTGNTFELGSFDFGYDPDSVQQAYERQTEQVDTLQGLNRVVDNQGLIPRVEVSGRIDGTGQEELWQKARNNALSYLSAEFQNGWSLITTLMVQNDPNAPDFVTGLYRYTAEFLIVKDPSGGIGQVSSFINHETRDTGTYTADSDAGDADAGSVDFQVSKGTVEVNGQTTSFGAKTVAARLGTTSYVYAVDPDGDGNGEVRVNQSAFPSDAGRLYTVETNSNGITTVTDERAAGTTGGTQTATTIGFTVDTGEDTDAGVSWDKTVLELSANASNYVYADGSTGDVSFNTSGFPSGEVALYEVQTDSNSVDVVLDQRATTTTGADDTVDTLGYDVNGGTGSINDQYVQWGDTTVQLDFGATNYVYVVDPDADGSGQVKANQSAVSSDALGLWEVTTDGNGITTETDLRDSLIDDGDDGDSDLTFRDRPQVFDGQVDFSRVMALGTDTVADPAVVDDYLGLSTLSEAVPDPTDGDTTFTGVSGLSESFTVADGGSATGDTDGGTAETVTWETATDWNSAVSESGMVHEATANTDYTDATVLRKGFSTENPPLSGNLQGYWLYQEDSSNTLYDFSQNGNDGSGRNSPTAGANGLLGTGCWSFNENNDQWISMPDNGGLVTGDWAFVTFINTTKSGTQTLETRDSESALSRYKQIDSFETRWYDGSNYNSSGDPFNSGQWASVGLAYDNSANDVLHIKNGSYVNTDSYSGDDDYVLDERHRERSGFRNADGRYGPWILVNTVPSSSDLQKIHDTVFGDSSLTTATKSLSTEGAPDLSALDYTLNGQTITIDVIGSPGTASEETQTATLDGASDYRLSWSNTHVDFRVQVTMSTSDPEVTPTLNSLTLKTGSSGDDSDQNPQTTWQVAPALYDRSGNEYEGGGAVSKYGG